MKLIKGKSYPKIPHLSSSKLGESDRYIEPHQERYLTEKTRGKLDTVFVFEKYDGANVAIAKIDGEIVALTRKGYTAKFSPYPFLHRFDNWVENRKDVFDTFVEEGCWLCAEWMEKTHGLKYEISTSNPIVFFDYMTPKGRFSVQKFEGKLMSMEEYASEEFCTPRLLHEGGAISPQQLIEELNKGDDDFRVVDDFPEGMIYRMETENRHGIDEFRYAAKWVRSDFVRARYMNDENEWNL